MEQTYTRHPDAKVDAPPEVKTNELAEGGEALSLPALMVRFPRMPEMWEAEKFQRLEADPTGGVSIERVSILWGGWVKERFGVDRNGEFEWKLADAMEDSDCLYLKVSSEHQVRWICLLPDTTRQIRARLLMKEFYLVAGSFDTREGAVVLAREIIAKGKDKKFYGFSPEVWSERTQAGKTRYLVVSGLTKDGLGRATSSKQEEILGLEIGVTSSSRFGERVFFE